MSESKTPVIQISGTVAEKDYISAVRARGIRFLWKYSVIYILLKLFLDLGISFYYWYPVLKDGNITFAQWLNEAWGTVFRASFGTCLIAGFLVLFAVYLIVIRPGLAKKSFHELFPDGLPVAYAFYDDTLVIRSATQTADQTFRLKYADVQRKIREYRYTIALSTGSRNMVSLYKTVMTPEEAKQVRKLLEERCPQRRGKA